MMIHRAGIILAALLVLLPLPAEAATRTYARPADQSMLLEQLQRVIDVALARTGAVIQVGTTTISITHPTLSASDDAAVNAALSAYVYDPLWNATLEAKNLGGKLPILRQWAQDARDEVAVWDGQTQVQKNAALKVLIDRLGKLLDNLADVLAVQGLSGP